LRRQTSVRRQSQVGLFSCGTNACHAPATGRTPAFTSQLLDERLDLSADTPDDLLAPVDAMADRLPFTGTSGSS
jgi:hypothetical protein